jgi:hypothetical protein
MENPWKAGGVSGNSLKLQAALIMQWNGLPAKLQGELFDNAGSMGELLDTSALRGQVARFLHKHKNDGGTGLQRPWA